MSDLYERTLQSPALDAHENLLELVDCFENANVGLAISDGADGWSRTNSAFVALTGGGGPPSESLSGFAAATGRTQDAYERALAKVHGGSQICGASVEVTGIDGVVRELYLDLAAASGRLLVVARPSFRVSCPEVPAMSPGLWMADATALDPEDVLAALDAEGLSGLTDELEMFFASIATPIHQISATGHIHRTNIAQARMLGYGSDPHELAGAETLAYFPDEEDIGRMGQHLHEGGGIAGYGAVMSDRNGVKVPVTIYSTVRRKDGEWQGTRCFAFYRGYEEFAG